MFTDLLYGECNDMAGNESVKKILVVEDERYLKKQLEVLLTQHGYSVATAASREEAAGCILNDNEISLYLLDVWLPDGEGFDLCSLIRKRTLKPVIFLTACDDEASVVKGLDMGADDYVSKPFRTAELLSRIQANLRKRGREISTKIWKSGELCVDIEAGTAALNQADLSLSPVEYRLLLVLMRNAGRIVRREALADHLWEDSEEGIGDNTLTVTVSRLRRKVGAKYIETIRGFGYRFTGNVEEYLE